MHPELSKPRSKRPSPMTNYVTRLPSTLGPSPTSRFQHRTSCPHGGTRSITDSVSSAHAALGKSPQTNAEIISTKPDNLPWIRDAPPITFKGRFPPKGLDFSMAGASLRVFLHPLLLPAAPPAASNAPPRILHGTRHAARLHGAPPWRRKERRGGPLRQNAVPRCAPADTAACVVCRFLAGAAASTSTTVEKNILAAAE